ncbi:MAG: ArsR/SmtB family transcription factor [Geminicoccaceae bacterium]
MRNNHKFLTVTADRHIDSLRGLASPARMRILQLLHDEGSLNINEISVALSMPQSTVATNVLILEETGLVIAEAAKGKKGHQKICSIRYDEILIRFDRLESKRDPDIIEISETLNWR